MVASVFAVGGSARAAPPPLTRVATGQAPCTPEPATPKRQLRAMWISSVVNIDWPSRPGISAETVQVEYRAWLDLAQRHHHNAVVVQLRPTADAFWPSPYEPWSEWLTGRRDGVSPGWDPLAFLVAETHRRNLEFHAWFNPYRVSMPSGAGPDIGKLAPYHPARQHPDWAVAYPANTADSRLYYNPGIPEARRFVEDAILEAVARYDIDGVHFDDYFYPYPAAGQDFADDATYARYGAGFATKADWRRDNVNRLIQEVGQRIKDLKPWVKFGVSPFGIWRNRATDPLGSHTSGSQSYDAIYADTRLWVKQQWIDYIVPQVYWNIGFGPADYALLVPWWSDVVSGTKVQLYLGQADYKIGTTGAWLDPAEMTRHLTFNRDHPQVLGDVHFSAKDVRADLIGGVSRYVADHYTRPALVPRMAHLPSRPLLSPLITGATRDAGTGAVTLTWRPLIQGPPFGTATSYAIYRFDGPALPDPCRFADATHLLTTQRGITGVPQTYTDSTAQPGHPYIYYLTALDRAWNESHPSPPEFIPAQTAVRGRRSPNGSRGSPPSRPPSAPSPPN
ncbi:MAG: family 10 glycosylhydrolase [Pseudonocardiaceae bacterium]